MRPEAVGAPAIGCAACTAGPAIAPPSAVAPPDGPAAQRARPSQGIGRVVPLRAGAGPTCRGYVSATVVTAIACSRDDAALVGFPEPLDVVPGPCVER